MYHHHHLQRVYTQKSQQLLAGWLPSRSVSPQEHINHHRHDMSTNFTNPSNQTTRGSVFEKKTTKKAIQTVVKIDTHHSKASASSLCRTSTVHSSKSYRILQQQHSLCSHQKQQFSPLVATPVTPTTTQQRTIGLATTQRL